MHAQRRRGRTLVAISLTQLIALAAVEVRAQSIAAPAARAPATERKAARLFVSGHSLTPEPFSSDIVAIARSLGLQADFQQQLVLGSPIRVRVKGMDLGAKGYPGYRVGENRAGARNLDVLAELKKPSTPGGPYDVLLITERHDLVNVLVWEDTVRYLRHFHDRVAAHEPRATTYLHHAWLNVSNLDDPSVWIAFEREAAAAWECVAERVNASLTAQKKPPSVVAVPSGIALTTLVERAIDGKIPALKGPTTRKTLMHIFTDDVHLTREAWHFMALVTFSAIYGRSPEGAMPALGMSVELARDLQRLAWEVVSAHAASRKPRGLAGCRKLMRESFCAASSRYRKQPSELGSCVGAFAEERRDGPFADIAPKDVASWLLPPP